MLLEVLACFSSARSFEPEMMSHYACSRAVSHEGVCGVRDPNTSLGVDVSFEKGRNVSCALSVEVSNAR